MGKQWFAYDEEEGFTAHVSEEAARADAEERLKSWNTELEGEDGESIDLHDPLTVSWGKIQVQATEREHPVDYHTPHYKLADLSP